MTTDQVSPEDVQRVTDDLAEGPVPESRATSTDTGAPDCVFQATARGGHSEAYVIT